MAVTVEPTASTTAIRPFTIDIPEADLEDLRARIAATRWPEKETVEDPSQGVQLATMQALYGRLLRPEGGRDGTGTSSVGWRRASPRLVTPNPTALA